MRNSKQALETDFITIPLTQDRYAVVDKEDGYLADLKWQAAFSSDGLRCYASRAIRNYEAKTTVKMHRLVASAMGIDSRFRIRHKDGDTLNNRRDNLEVIQPDLTGESECFENYVLSDRLNKVLVKDEIIEAVQGIIADGQIPTAELMAARLGFKCYSHRPSLGVTRETLCFTELKDIFMMLPQELLNPIEAAVNDEQ